VGDETGDAALIGRDGRAHAVTEQIATIVAQEGEGIVGDSEE
jgi:hypothetical protein